MISRRLKNDMICEGLTYSTRASSGSGMSPILLKMGGVVMEVDH